MKGKRKKKNKYVYLGKDEVAGLKISFQSTISNPSEKSELGSMSNKKLIRKKSNLL